MLVMASDRRASAFDPQQARSKANRILEMIEVLMLTANAAPDPRTKARKISLIRRHLNELNELMDENPVLRQQEEERFEALAEALKRFSAHGKAAASMRK